MTDSIDWFVGSATKEIPLANGTVSDGRIHALGFRGDDQLFALVICDLDHVAGLDVSSVNFHINLHPITPVQVVLVSSGRTPAPDIRHNDAVYNHQLVHIITDCVIDALTFGCPATIRTTADAIQWRKFDEQPIATLVFHDATHDNRHTSHTELIDQCGDPVMHATLAYPAQSTWSVSQLTHQLSQAEPQPLRHIAWQSHAYGWDIMLNQVHLVINGTTGDYVITSTPERMRVV